MSSSPSLLFLELIVGAPLMIHPGRSETSPFEIVQILEEAGADLSQVAFAHSERTMVRSEDFLRLARKGCYVEFDLFGLEWSHAQVSCNAGLN